jgi:hypothetical protein
MRSIRNSYKTSLGITEGKTPLGRPRRRWHDKLTLMLEK